jgi:hypothetical protein
MLKRLLPVVLALGMCALHCAPSRQLTSAELAKIDPYLLPVLTGGSVTSETCVTHQRADGVTTYNVIIRGSVDDVRNAGITVNSAIGDVITANLTADELRRVAMIATVRSISCGSTNTIQ